MHYRVICERCGITISTCRCFDPNKIIRYAVCARCKVKGKEED